MEIAVDIGEVLSIPLAMPAMAALTITGAAAGKHYRLVDAVNGQKSYPNLYALAVSPRGTGKSSVANVLINPFLKANEEQKKKFELRMPSVTAEVALLNTKKKNLLRPNAPLEEADIVQELTGIEARLEDLMPNGTQPVPPKFSGGKLHQRSLGKKFESFRRSSNPQL